MEDRKYSTLQILKKGAGDVKIVIDTEADIAEANTLISDMTRQGYLISTDAGEKVTGVSTTGSFVVKSGPKETKEAEPGTTATAVAPVAGG